MTFILRIHRRLDGTVLLAICDKEVCGKKHVEGKLQIDASSTFYKGEEATEEEVKSLFHVATHLNLVGQKAIELAKSMGYVQRDKVVKISGVPYAECVIVRES
ncbi:MAG: DUF424 family protein [Nanoarchaeota archaeon]